MRSFLPTKHFFLTALTALLIVSLVAPPFIQACDCLSDSGETPGAAVVRTADAEAFPESCCCGKDCGPKAFAVDFFDAMGKKSACDTHPVCCCVNDDAKNQALDPAIVTDAPRPRFIELKHHQAGSSAFLTDPHHINSQFCFAFHANIISPTPPHIASTVLLI